MYAVPAASAVAIIVGRVLENYPPTEDADRKARIRVALGDWIGAPIPLGAASLDAALPEIVRATRAAFEAVALLATIVRFASGTTKLDSYHMVANVPPWLLRVAKRDGTVRDISNGFRAQARQAANRSGLPGFENALVQGYRAATWAVRSMDIPD